MNLEFSDEQKFVQQSARDYLQKECELALNREVLESAQTHANALWKGVAEMGWLGAAVPEQYGGAGTGRLELALIAMELGRALAPVPFSSSVYLATELILEAGSEAQKEKYLPQLCKGDAIGTLALAEGAGDFNVQNGAAEFAGGKLNGAKLPVADGCAATLAVVTAKEGDGHSLALVQLNDAGVKREAVESLDPSRPPAKLHFNDAPAERLGKAGAAAETVERVLDRAAVWLAYEQVGGAERALDITREQTMGRFAFGRPVASFQALKHRMADVYGQTQIALANGYWAAWALENAAPELGAAAAAARVAASTAFILASEEMIQMHGGVGFTWEYDCHLFYRRAQATAFALGAPHEWRDKLVARAAAAF